MGTRKNMHFHLVFIWASCVRSSWNVPMCHSKSLRIIWNWSSINRLFLTICNVETNELYPNDEKNEIIKFNQDIAPNESIKILVWIHGAQLHRHLIQFHFSYW